MTYEAVADLVRLRAGLVFPPPRRHDMEAGTRKIMTRTGVTDMAAFLDSLRTETSLLDELVAEITIGETYFFREPDHFDFIRNDIVPELRRLRGTEHTLRVWSAGCSTGEEPYTLAIVFEELGLAARTRILATDISRTALVGARDAEYGPWSLRGNGADLAGPYLRRSGARFGLAERIRLRVDFAYLNLAQDTYPSLVTDTWGMDLVMCRNVLIYFDMETCRAVGRRLYKSLAPGAFLITGPSDPLLADYAPFETLTTRAGIMYRKPTPHDRPSKQLPAATTVSPAARGEPALWTTPLEAVAVTPPVPTHPAEPLREVREVPARDNDVRAVESTQPVTANVAAIVAHVRAIANLGDMEAALTLAAEATTQHPDSLDIGFLHAVLLMNLARYAEAVRALRRVLYLDRSLAVAQFALGTALHRLGKLDGAARAYGNARDLAAQRSAEEVLTLSDGEQAGRLATAAVAQLALLESRSEPAR